MAEYLSSFRAQCGTASGSGNKRGGFKIVEYKQTFFHRRGLRRAKGKVNKTFKEFADAMVAKGATRAWAEDEFHRRRAAPEHIWENGVDGDTGLPTVQMHSSETAEEYTDKGIDDTVEFKTAAKKNLNAKVAAEMVSKLGSDGLDDSSVHALMAGGKYEELLVDFKDSSQRKTFLPSEFIKKRKALESGEEEEVEQEEEGDTVARANGSAEKKTKFVDMDGKVGHVQFKATNIMELLTESMDAAMNEANEAIPECEDLVPHDRAVFEPRLKSIKERMEALVKVNDSVAVFEAWVTEVKSKHENNSGKLPIPEPHFSKLAARESLKEEATKITGVDDAELEAADTAWKAKAEACSILVQAVKSAVSYFHSARNSRERYIENRQKQQCAKAKAKAAAKAATTPVAKSKFAVFDLSLDQHMEIIEVSHQSPSEAKHPCGPWVYRQSDGLKASLSITLKCYHATCLMSVIKCGRIFQC